MAHKFQQTSSASEVANKPDSLPAMVCLTDALSHHESAQVVNNGTNARQFGCFE